LAPGTIRSPSAATPSPLSSSQPPPLPCSFPLSPDRATPRRREGKRKGRKKRRKRGGRREGKEDADVVKSRSAVAAVRFTASTSRRRRAVGPRRRREDEEEPNCKPSPTLSRLCFLVPERCRLPAGAASSRHGHTSPRHHLPSSPSPSDPRKTRRTRITSTTSTMLKRRTRTILQSVLGIQRAE
ncbi:unnamed protein product, partial [Urochloa humidicola]